MAGQAIRIIVLGGDETGQELLDEAVRVLDSDVLGMELELEHPDLSLECRRETANGVVCEAAEALRSDRFGIKAATVTPEAATMSAARTASCASRSTDG